MDKKYDKADMLLMILIGAIVAFVFIMIFEGAISLNSKDEDIKSGQYFMLDDNDLYYCKQFPQRKNDS